MIQKHRISTNIGVDQKITVELKQDFDILEILSLKFSQQEVYTSLCSDYGVVCGRVTANNGFGLGNARVSIFIPLSTEDEDDPVISTLYPYKQTTDKDENGYRYNLLPLRKQHGGHEPTGTFPDQSDILNREEVLEVFEKYYKYTVKTNSAGDFMIWGVPVGNQTVHVDVDLSDIGCFSLRPYDFQRQGVGVDKFKNKYSFKASEDLNSLPQIITFDKVIQVYSFWGNESLCEIGLTRTDFDLTEKGVNIQPKAYLIGGIFTDSGKNAINKSCTPRRKMGRKCDLTTKSAKIETIRFTPNKDEFDRPYLEVVDLHEDIPEDGGFVVPLEMNMDYVYTNEFGENEITNDPNKGIPTSSCYRMRMNMNDNGLSRVRANADFLLPNIREYHHVGGDPTKALSIDDSSYYFGTDWSGYPENAISLILNNVDGEFYPQDYFYRFSYNKVYTVSSFNSHYIGNDWFGFPGYANINDAHPTEEEDCGDKNTPPTNYGVKNYTFTLLIADFLLLLDFFVKYVTLLFYNILVHTVGAIGEILNGLTFIGTDSVRGYTSKIMINNYTKLSLISYPDCIECSSEDIQTGASGVVAYCSVGDLDINVTSGVITVSNQEYFLEDSIDCVGTHTLLTSDSDFVANQTKYILYNIDTDTYIPLGVGAIFSIVNSTLTFVDGGSVKYFIQDGDYYSLQIYDASSVEFTVPPTELGCLSYDTLYDDNIITGYYVDNDTTSGGVPAQYGNRRYYGTLPQGVNPTSSLISGNYLTLKWPNEFTYRQGGGYKGRYDCRDIWEDYYIEAKAAGLPASFRSEFKNGVFHIVPGTQSNKRMSAIVGEYYRRKRVNKMFCGGIVNFGFLDNWLSGSLYFFQFKVKNIASSTESGISYCRDLVRFVFNQKRFYYRSAPTLDGSTFSSGYLKRPTTFVDLGPRDEFIKETCIDKSLDPNCSVSRSIGATSYQDMGDILGLAINYRMDVAGAAGNLNMFFDNTGLGGFIQTNNVLDGDILQLLSINNEVGIDQFDLQNPKYYGYNYNILDPEVYPEVFKNGNANYGPLPITFDLTEDGYRIRTCLNEPYHLDYALNPVNGRLTESSQSVPFYLWDKKGTGFGPYNTNKNNQSWDWSEVQLDKLQGMTYGYNITGLPNDSSDKYALLPMTYTFSGTTIHDVITTTVANEFDYMYRWVESDTGHTEIITRLNQENNQYPGYTVLYITGGTYNSPTRGRLFTRYGGAYTGGTVTTSLITGNTSNNTVLVSTGDNGWNANDWLLSTFSIKRTKDYYHNKTKQILSTPFQFYFGLIAGKTGMDKFIDQYGPKGAFPSAE
jgi:hypothetical protein